MYKFDEAKYLEIGHKTAAEFGAGRKGGRCCGSTRF